MLFLPYTGMCISFAVIGSIVATPVHWDRLASIALIYGLALGVSAHAADAMGSRIKPWAQYFTKHELILMVSIPLVISYGLGLYYILFFAPMLAIFAALEGFFLLAYNFEWFNGLFHNNPSFVVSWGVLPVLSGFAIQGSNEWIVPSIASIGAGIAAYYHISLSRPYKEFKRGKRTEVSASSPKALERKLKFLSCAIIGFTVALMMARGLLL
jgi:hypothetical protein